MNGPCSTSSEGVEVIEQALKGITQRMDLLKLEFERSKHRLEC